MNSPSCVLVAIDFSPLSRTAFEQALKHARLAQARVVAVHVVESDVWANLAECCGVSSGQLEKWARVRALEEIRSWTGEFERAEVEPVVVSGKPEEAILKVAKQTGANLLVLGATGAGDHPSGVGHVAAHCAETAREKVLLVNPNHARAARTILAFVDFSEASRAVVEQALRIATASQSEIHFLHVYRPPWKWHSSLSYSGGKAPELHDYYRGTLQHRFEEFVNGMGGVKSRYDLREAEHPGSGIAACARILRPEYVIVNRQGKVVKDLLANGRERRLLKELPVSLLAVGEEDARPEARRISAAPEFAPLPFVR